MKTILVLLICILVATIACGQVNLGGGYQGVPYIPSFSTTAQNAINPAPVGLFLFNSTAARPSWYDGVQWVFDVGTQASVSLTAQAASITSTALLTAPPPGVYVVCYNETVLTVGTTSSIQTTIGWNNGGAKTSTLASLNGGALQTAADATNTQFSELAYCLPVRVASGNLTYATTYASTGTPMTYSLNVTASRVQ